MRTTECVGTNGAFEAPPRPDPMTRLTAKERDALALGAELDLEAELEPDRVTHRRVLAALACLNLHAACIYATP